MAPANSWVVMTNACSSYVPSRRVHSVRWLVALVGGLCLVTAPLAQPTGAGDIMIVGFDADVDDGFAFVTFVDIPAGTFIRFTDRNWDGSAFASGEGTVSWSNGTGSTIPAGTVVRLERVDKTTISASIGSASRSSGSLSLSAENEVIYAHLGFDGSPTYFLTAFANDGFANGDGTLSGTGLVEGLSATSISGDEDVAVYTGSTTCLRPRRCAELVADASNFSTQDGTGDQSTDATAPDYPADVPASFTVTGASVVQDSENTAGWRLLSIPVTDATVGDLAFLNLVQGVPAGAGDGQAQFPNGDDILFLAYTPASSDPDDGTYVAASATGESLVAGEGFFWYLFNNDVIPRTSLFGGGTSRSYSLSHRDLRIAGSVLTGDASVTFANSANGFYMIGNPFADPLATTGIGFTGTGSFQDNLQAYDPGTGFVSIDRTVATNYLATWQGVFAEVDAGSGSAMFTFDIDVVDPGQTPTFYGRRTPSRVTLALSGDLDSGAQVTDRAASLSVRDYATLSWDRADASKLVPPDADHALLAFVGQKDGADRRQSVFSVPSGLAEPVEIPVHFLSTGRGAFSVTPEGLVALPSGWTATLRDLVSGAESTLQEGQPIAFDADAGSWSQRFVLTLTPIVVDAEDGPVAASVSLLHPNPTAGRASLAVTVGRSQRVAVTVVDALGRRVATAFEGQVAGAETIDLDTAPLAPGVYTVLVVGESFREGRQLVVVR